MGRRERQHLEGTGFAGVPWLWLAGGTVAILALRGSSMATSAGKVVSEAFDWARGEAFAAALPSNIGRWAPQILSAARRYDVDPWVLAGIMWGESRGGDVLTPPGDPGGTGDFIPRGADSSYFRYANPATGLPPDGKGWGRGLMQVDYGVHNAWVTSSAWWEPQVNIDKGAAIFSEFRAFFTKAPTGPVKIEAWRLDRGIPKYGIEPWRTKYPNVPMPPTVSSQKYAQATYTDPRPLSGVELYVAALAAYNAGPGGVLQALALGLPAEAPTTRQSYVTSFASRVAGWRSKF